MSEHGTNTVHTRQTQNMREESQILKMNSEAVKTREIVGLLTGLSAAKDIIAIMYELMNEEQRKKIDDNPYLESEIRELRHALAWV